jgi:hypothetical protein
VATKSKKKLEQLNEAGSRNSERRKKKDPVAKERRQGQRRRLIDPTTCERDYNQDEIEFMQAMDEYKRRSGRMFPTCSEILEVIKGMGYRRVAADGMTEEMPDSHNELASDQCEDETALEEEFSL